MQNNVPCDQSSTIIYSENWLKDCEEFLTLSMPGKTESLNAAVAGSIVLYLSTIK